MPNVIASLKVLISYNTLCVFHAEIENPYNDWNETHIYQGFAWRPESVGFFGLENASDCDMTVQTDSQINLRPDTVRAIQVPFSVSAGQQVIVGSLMDETTIDVPAGDYCLVCELGLLPLTVETSNDPDDDEVLEWQDIWCVFTFVPCQNAQAKILRQDKELSPPTPLYLKGWSA